MQYLYLIKCQEFYKIGITNDMENRLAQLSTGNPYSLEVVSVYGYQNAEFVERAIHQRFSGVRERGEWFKLTQDDISDYEIICQRLGGFLRPSDPISEDDIEEAEVMAEPQEGGKWDYAGMFADGWRMEYSGSVSSGTKNKVWVWRRGSGKERKALYGGSISSLPYQDLETMRHIYRKDVE